MEEVSLYRKYRPHNFDNLVGQDHVKTTLINAIKTKHISHAYLFTGPRGTGKTSTARLIAKALSCSNLQDGFEPCDSCEFCNDINDGRLIDLIEVDAASNRGIDEVRDLKEKINFAPTRGNVKIYIIDEVHMMTKEAFNALLKTLEEPPAHAYFILATTEVHKIPETIISRCQRFDFRRISTKALMTRLSYICQKEGIQADDSALEAISRYADGGLRDAIGLVEQLTSGGRLSGEHVQEILGVSDLSLLEGLYAALEARNAKEGIRIIHELHNNGSDLRQFVHEFVDILRHKLLASVTGDNHASTATLIKMIEVFQETTNRLESGIPQLPLEIAVIKIAGPVVEGAASATEVVKTAEAKPVMAAKVAEDRMDEERMPATVAAPTVEKPGKAVDKPDEARDHKKIEDKSANAVALDLANIRSQWPRIVERVKTPALRMTIKNGRPVAVEGTEIVVEFATNFDRDKVMEHDYRVELEGVIEGLMGTSVRVVAQVRALEIKPVVDEEQESAADEALEIFGGELVE